MLDLIVSRDIPEENDDDNANDNEGGDGSKDGGGAAASGGDKGKDKDKKDDKGNTNSKDKSRDVNTYVKKKAEDKSENKNTSADGGSGNGKTDAKNKPGDGGGIVEEDENLVDLFLDLSVADTAGGWSIYGSSESLPQPESIMPAYFNTDQFYVETENHVRWRDSDHDRPFVV